jgi:hypothetical protein
MFPRAALWLLSYALEERRRRLSSNAEPPLLDGRSLRDAMPRVSQQRLAELKRECSESERARILALKNFPSYQDEEKFLRALEQVGESDPTSALQLFENLGIVERGARRDGTPTVKIVDLYAFAPELKIERLGRR